jgi:aspartate racemase
VADGYLHRPDLTAERFVEDPWGGPGARLYRTGDRVRYRADGTLEYLGRLDHQVKLRGFRIELGEIEAALRGHAGVREAVVVLHGTGAAARLVGYVVGEAGGLPTPAVLKAQLRETLPDYMVPTALVALDALPLTPNGKLDRAALPAPDEASVRLDTSAVPPRDTLERQLTGIWQTVLQVPSVGVTDNFFDLGGHSLLAIRLFTQIERATGQQLPLASLFKAPTIEQLADLLRTEGWSESWASLVPIQPEGTRPPLYCVHAAGGHVLFYRDLAKYLDRDQPLYGLQAQGLDGTRPAHSRVEDMAAHYITEVRALQPTGPYYLAGECFGGRIAFEMARQLQALGEQVAFLGLFNTFGPGYPKPLPGKNRFRERVDFFRLRFIDHHLSNLLLMGPREQFGYVREKVSDRARPWKDQAFRRKRLKELARGVLDRPLRAVGGSLPGSLQQTQNALWDASTGYVPQPYSGKVTLFRATKQPVGIYPDPTLGWGGIATGELEIHDVPGSAIVLEPRVRVLAEQLTACLEKARADAARRTRDSATLADDEALRVY